MHAKRVVHTGANIHEGGVNAGFTIPAYHVGIAGAVKKEPAIPANSHTTMEMISRRTFLRGICFSISNHRGIATKKAVIVTAFRYCELS